MIMPIMLAFTEILSLVLAVWNYATDDILRAIYWMTFVVAINVGWRKR